MCTNELRAGPNRAAALARFQGSLPGCVVGILLAGVLLAASGCSGAGSEFAGTLDHELSPASSQLAYQRVNLRPMSPEERVAWEVPSGVTDQVFEARIHLPPNQSWNFVLVESPESGLRAFVDLDQDQRIGKQESLDFEPSSDPEFSRQALLEIPLPGSVFPSFPIRIRFWKNSIVREGKVYSARAIVWSTFAALQGSIEIDGRNYRLTYEGLLPGHLQLDPRQAILGIDGDSNGEIDFNPLSPEWAMARNQTVILRAGDHYLSFERLDPVAGQVILKAHPPSEYTRIELRRGNEIPDFSFLDFEGRRRSLGEFRGRFVLLDFWGSWCGPCLAEYPNLVETYREFGPRGFEVLGMDSDPAPQQLRRGVTSEELDQGLTKARATIERFAAGWPQARTGSIMKLVLERFQIYAYPSSILLDPEGKIVSCNEPDRPLRGPGLKQTLIRLLAANE